MTKQSRALANLIVAVIGTRGANLPKGNDPYSLRLRAALLTALRVTDVNPKLYEQLFSERELRQADIDDDDPDDQPPVKVRLIT